MEQILIRNLPPETEAALRARAQKNQRSLEVEARALLVEAVQGKPATIVDLLAMDSGGDIEFEPEKLGLQIQTPEL